MRSVNKVILIGNLTRSPELKQTSNGQSIVTFGLATNRQWTTSSGERRDSAEFHECVAWAKLAEICKNYLKKGMLVYVEGYLKTRSWDMEDGTRRFRTEIVLHDMIMLEKRADGKYIPADGEDLPSGDDLLEDPTEEVVAEETPAVEEKASTEEEPTKEEAEAAVPAPGGLSADLDDDNMF